ncbi:MAG: hypothetical protein IK127_07685 [Clostridia bacterium]|nr:hypothetical protein [Clostridia bacterium]
MKKILVLVLALAALLCIAAAASAVTIPENVKDLDIPEIPALPTMHCKNDGVTQTITFSESVDWMAVVFCDGHDWTWNDVTWASPEHTEATADMTAHKQSPGYGFWANSTYDDEGTCTWSGTGFYEMDYAYDVVLKDGTDVKYNQFGDLAELTLKNAGSEYFGNGPSIGTTILVKFEGNSVGRFVPYVDEIKEDYRNGSSIHARFAMNGMPTWVYQILPDGSRKTLYVREQPEEGNESNGEQGEEEPGRPSHQVAPWWVEWSTPDSEIEVPENGYIKYVQMTYVNHGEDVAVVTKAQFEAGVDGDGNSLPEYSWTWEESEEKVHLQKEVLDTPDGIPTSEYNPDDWPSWYGHYEVNHKEVWVYDD